MKAIFQLKSLFLAAFMMSALFATAQSTAEAYTAENEGWLVNIDEAYKQSQESGKPILANFTGSNWCGWCKRLTKSVFSKDEFKTWADENVVLLELDFPKGNKTVPADIAAQNRNLQQAFKVRGYPTIWVFDLEKDAAGEFNISALGKTGYRKTVAEFTADVDQMIAKR